MNTLSDTDYIHRLIMEGGTSPSNMETNGLSCRHTDKVYRVGTIISVKPESNDEKQ